MPVTLTEPWSVNGVTFPVGTFFVRSATAEVWDWKTPNGSWGRAAEDEDDS
jgi:hypothetical protein